MLIDLLSSIFLASVVILYLDRKSFQTISSCCRHLRKISQNELVVKAFIDQTKIVHPSLVEQRMKRTGEPLWLAAFRCMELSERIKSALPICSFMSPTFRLELLSADHYTGSIEVVYLSTWWRHIDPVLEREVTVWSHAYPKKQCRFSSKRDVEMFVESRARAIHAEPMPIRFHGATHCKREATLEEILQLDFSDLPINLRLTEPLWTVQPFSAFRETICTDHELWGREYIDKDGYMRFPKN